MPAGNVTGLQYTEVFSDIISTENIFGGIGTSVGYNAGSTIKLNPGFRALAGTKFEAYLQGYTTAGLPPHSLRRPSNRIKLNEVQDYENINAEGDKKTLKLFLPNIFINNMENKIMNAEGDVTNPTGIKNKAGIVIPNVIKPEGDQ